MVLRNSKSLPRYVAIYQHLAEAIKSGHYKPGDRLPTEDDLMKSFDVGRQTVLKALSQLKVEQYIVRQQGSGSYVAERAATPIKTRSKAVGVVCSNLADGFAHQVVLGVESTLRAAGYESILCNSDYSVSLETSHLRRLHAQGAAGVLLLPYLPPANLELIESLRHDPEHPMHCVCLDRGYPGSDLPLVKVDNYRAVYDAISYLIELGHRRIGFIVASIAFIHTIEAIRERYRGYRQALHDHGIRFDRDLIQEVGPTMASMRPQEVGLEHYGYQPMHKLLTLKTPPTAVFLLWDELAPGALAAIRNSGFDVPQDISLIGFNDDLLARLMPVPLTTIRQPAQEIGREAADLMIGLLENKPETVRQRVLTTQMIIRASTRQCGGTDPLVLDELAASKE